MPISVIIAIVTYLLSASSVGKSKAAKLAVAAGLGTYAYQSYTGADTGFGSSESLPTGTQVVPTLDAQGNPILNADGTQQYDYITGGVTSATAPSPGFLESIAGVLKSWGGTGTAAVIGTTAIATSGTSTLAKWAPWVLGGFVVGKALKII